MNFNLDYWINTKDYTPATLIWNGIGCLFWLVTYAAMVRSIIKNKFVEMPFVVAAGNIAWEFVWSFCVHPTTGKFYAMSYQGCFFLDVYIFAMMFKYGHKQIEIPVIKKYFKLILVGLAIIWLPLNYFYVMQGYDTPVGANSGYILSLFISLLYPMLLLRNQVTNFSPVVAWCKFIGTGCVTVSMFLMYPTNYFVQILGGACFFLDCGFAIMLSKKLKEQKNETSRVPA